MKEVIGWLALAVLIAGEIAASLVATFQRSPWCWCGHPREMHQHDRPGTDCPKCLCDQFSGPIIRRQLSRS